MMALTIAQPWPYFFTIADRPKRLENREWLPPASLLKPGQWLALHGGKVELKGSRRTSAYEQAIHIDRWLDLHLPAAEMTQAKVFRYAGIFAVGQYAGYVQQSDDRWFSGEYGWCFSELVVLPRPIACRGSQKLWRVPDQVLEEIRLQWKESR